MSKALPKNEIVKKVEKRQSLGTTVKKRVKGGTGKVVGASISQPPMASDDKKKGGINSHLYINVS